MFYFVSKVFGNSAYTHPRIDMPSIHPSRLGYAQQVRALVSQSSSPTSQLRENRQ